MTTAGTYRPILDVSEHSTNKPPPTPPELVPSLSRTLWLSPQPIWAGSRVAGIRGRGSAARSLFACPLRTRLIWSLRPIFPCPTPNNHKQVFILKHLVCFTVMCEFVKHATTGTFSLPRLKCPLTITDNSERETTKLQIRHTNFLSMICED